VTATIVRIAKEHRIVEVVHEMPRAPAQSAQLPPWEQLALQYYRVEPRSPAKLKRSKERPLIESFVCY
jgi:hypothetical protein